MVGCWRRGRDHGPWLVGGVICLSLIWVMWTVWEGVRWGRLGSEDVGRAVFSCWLVVSSS